jgi:hypothetical protein
LAFATIEAEMAIVKIERLAVKSWMANTLDSPVKLTDAERISLEVSEKFDNNTVAGILANMRSSAEFDAAWMVLKFARNAADERRSLTQMSYDDRVAAAIAAAAPPAPLSKSEYTTILRGLYRVPTKHKNHKTVKFLQWWSNLPRTGIVVKYEQDGEPDDDGLTEAMDTALRAADRPYGMSVTTAGGANLKNIQDKIHYLEQMRRFDGANQGAGPKLYTDDTYWKDWRIETGLTDDQRSEMMEKRVNVGGVTAIRALMDFAESARTRTGEDDYQPHISSSARRRWSSSTSTGPARQAAPSSTRS